MIQTDAMPENLNEILLGEFALLEVVAIEEVGVFLDWGLAKNLFLPYAEQTKKLKVGEKIIIYTSLDKSERICASMRLDRNKYVHPANYSEGQSVLMLIVGPTDLGFKAIIQNRHWGVLYKNEVFEKLHYGQQINGFIKKIREDGKLDLCLQHQTGHQAADPIAVKIVELLEKKNGFLPVNDKTSAELIYELFGASKKKYKIALGGLYKKRIIQVNNDGIVLIEKTISKGLPRES